MAIVKGERKQCRQMSLIGVDGKIAHRKQVANLSILSKK
jgi:hypothetical protein